MDKKIDVVLQWFSHVEKMENDRIAKVCVGEGAGSRSVGRPRKRWTDILKDCLKKRGSDVRQARRMAHDGSVWQGFVRGKMGRSPGDQPLTLTRCYSCEIPQSREALERGKSVCGQACVLRA